MEGAYSSWSWRFSLKEKFRLIKDSLRWWNKTVFGKYDLEMEEGVRELNEADESDVMGDEIQLVKTKASGRFWLNLKIKENMLIQKSRLKWLNDGDSNSKYFHRVMKERRRRNHISSIVTRSGIMEKVEDVKEEVRRHFNSKFKEDNFSRPILENASFNSLSMEESASLESPFNKEEIKEAVWNCDGSKSPGPDGFTLFFVKNCWYFLKEDLMACFKEFFSGGSISKSITSSFLSLIPKSSNPLGLDDFCNTP
ncbi:uncharacterized protein LOC131619189 [Vicia villosa]|uniref:uncharacterized protein LOC131619189 n=1 Tax=Vicia villosa TaxID=3911 RepID=UPI00273AB6D9|nr:uncharacterized protein LOC131619189 [Vicia villosa]